MKYFSTLLIPILILCAAQADALLQPFTVDELSKLSKFIIIGTVMDVKPAISDEKAALSDDLDALLYDVTMGVEKDLTNQYKNDTIKFRIMGNRDLGSYSKAVEDSQEFTAGERVLVFLADKEPKSIWGDNYYVAGITIGKYTLYEGHAYGIHYNGILEDELISKIQESRFQYPTSGSGMIKKIPPLKQFKSGTPAQYVNCNEGLELLIKASNGHPICVKPSTKAKLLDIKWAEPTRILGYLG